MGTRTSSGVRILFGAAVLAAGAVTVISGTATSAQASTSLHYTRGYSVQGSWLCYGWSNGSYHCTQRWHRSGSKLVSDNPSWVPNTSTSSSSSVAKSSSSSVKTVSTTVQTAGQPCRASVQWPKTISQWTVPLGCYSKIYAPNPSSYPSRPSFGYCNWWPEVLHPQYSGSSALHLTSHSTPKAGAVVWFSPGVQGASSDGHYAQVVAVSPGGKWVLVTEMNFIWRGGGFKKVDYRFIHTGSGVSFRY